MAGKAKLGAIDLDDRRASDKGPNELFALCDHLWSYGILRRVHCNIPRLVDSN
jgi:hypothetical protein